MIRGLELWLLTPSGHAELDYRGGRWLGPDGVEIDDLMDMACTSCGERYYTRESEALEFCPHCGRFDRRRFESFEDVRAWARGHDWGFAAALGVQYVAVLEGGRWGIAPTRDPQRLARARKFEDIRPLQ